MIDRNCLQRKEGHGQEQSIVSVSHSGDGSDDLTATTGKANKKSTNQDGDEAATSESRLGDSFVSRSSSSQQPDTNNFVRVERVIGDDNEVLVSSSSFSSSRSTRHDNEDAPDEDDTDTD